MAAAAGIAVGAVTLYLARLFVSRERVELLPPSATELGGGGAGTEKR